MLHRPRTLRCTSRRRPRPAAALGRRPTRRRLWPPRSRSIASTSSSLGLDLPPAEAPELLTYAQLYDGASGFNVYGFEAEFSELCWDSDSSGDAPLGS